MPSDNTSGSAGTVRSVNRALTLLNFVAEAIDGLRLTDLASRSGLSPSTVHRLMTTLEGRHFVQFNQTEATWHIGRQAFVVGANFVQRRNVAVQALPFLRQLRDLTRETANLGIVENAEVVVLTRIESREIMRAITHIGGTAPMLASGMGKAILSTYPLQDVAAVVEHQGLRPLTAATITSPAALARELAEARLRGYAVDDEEYVQGLRCVAAPVFGHDGGAVCAISVSGLHTRFVTDRIPKLAQCVRRIADGLTQTLARAVGAIGE